MRRRLRGEIILNATSAELLSMPFGWQVRQIWPERFLWTLPTRSIFRKDAAVAFRLQHRFSAEQIQRAFPAVKS